MYDDPTLGYDQQERFKLPEGFDPCAGSETPDGEVIRRRGIGRSFQLKEVHKYIVCIGSNYNRKENLTFARQELTESFSSICFAPELEN